MGVTTVDLYRSGNASGPCMHKVRLAPLPDVDHYTDVHGHVWVKAGTGGISTFETPAPNWRGKAWRLRAGATHPASLRVWSDSPGHWLWEPANDMRLSDFCRDLESMNALFVPI
jgi:hypothetical protein